MEGDFIKINKWLLPFSWIYGLVVWFRNQLFDIGILKSKDYKIPVIAVGNITVGGAGKTPHVEYLIRLLKDKVKVAVLSRGYKRKSKGFVLADMNSTVEEIGDEPYQMKKKFPDIDVAVDKNRQEGIELLTNNTTAKDIDVIILDDAYQHRYVKPGINILLVDYHRLLLYDKLLPAGRLREPKESTVRADMVIITKCPTELKPMDYRVITRAMNLYPYQTLLFSTLKYGNLIPVYSGDEQTLDSLNKEVNVLLLTGIASPKQMVIDLKPYAKEIVPLTFRDHHQFSHKDIVKINEKYSSMPSPKIIVTTEKDMTRLINKDGFSEEVKQNMFMLPIEIEIQLGQEEIFNQKIISYVQKNSRNSILAKTKDDHKPKNSNNSGNRTRTISFRNN
ncbi:MAG: tetraacyldisaccharide 4'-kinase [Prevotella sp.]|nr:tetraacyldisaccharide 4'-kinase [Prevotella sp.]